MTTKPSAESLDLPRADQRQVSTLIDLFIPALRGLGAAGDPDLAGRLAGRAWALLRAEDPRNAERLNGLLHYLARLPSTDDTPTPSTPIRTPEESTMTATSPELDVRQEIPARRHELIFATYRALAAGDDFVLVNDHDPKPLYYQFAAEHAGEFTWDYLQQGPEVWKVRIGRITTS